MSQHDIEIAALQGAAIRDPRVAEVTMTSPYLYHIRSTRKIIEQLILAREIELPRATATAERRRVERDLTFLRDELARIDAKAAAGGSSCQSCNRQRIAPR
jgi:hypothetical protein